MQCDVCLLGNHDQGALFDPEGFNTGAERAIFWTRDQLESPPGDPDENAKRWDFLGELPRNRRENGFLFVHGSARNPLNEYVFPEDIYNQRKMEKIFSLIEQHCFQGHTHVPGVFTQSLNFFSPEEINGVYRLGDEKTMINVGSVGQPRDGDPRSCYVVLEDEHAHVPPGDVRSREDDQEDLRHPGTRQLSGRPAARGTLADRSRAGRHGTIAPAGGPAVPAGIVRSGRTRFYASARGITAPFWRAVAATWHCKICGVGNNYV